MNYSEKQKKNNNNNNKNKNTKQISDYIYKANS